MGDQLGKDMTGSTFLQAQKHSVGDTPEIAVKENKQTEENAEARQVNGHVVQPQSQPTSEGKQ